VLARSNRDDDLGMSAQGRRHFRRHHFFEAQRTGGRC
jgi:hypothetical protein